MLDKTKLITAASINPVTLTEARAHLRITDTSEDTLISTLIGVATEYAEKRTGRALISQTWELYLDNFPYGANYVSESPDYNQKYIDNIEESQFIEMKFPPLASVTSITYYDSNNALQTFAASNYDVDIIRQPGMIRLGYGKSWPSTYYRPNAVIIRYVAGYGSATTDIPEPIRAAIKLLVSFFFENREAVTTFNTVQQIPIPQVIEDLLNQYCLRERC